MAKKPNPWFWEARNLWCVKNRRRAAYPRRASRRVARPAEEQKDRPLEPAAGNPRRLSPTDVAASLSPPPRWKKPPTMTGSSASSTTSSAGRRRTRQTLTAKRYEEFCQGFVQAEVGRDQGRQAPGGEADRQARYGLDQFGEEAWGPTTKRNAITALQAALNWAVLNRGWTATHPGHEEARGQAAHRHRHRPKSSRRSWPWSRTAASASCWPSYDCGAGPSRSRIWSGGTWISTGVVRSSRRTRRRGANTPATVYFPTDRSMADRPALCEINQTGPIFLEHARATVDRGRREMPISRTSRSPSA